MARRLIDIAGAVTKLSPRILSKIEAGGSDAEIYAEVQQLLAEQETVDSVPVDEIILHHILVDENGIPEVKLQLGERILILRNEAEPVDVRELVHGRCIYVRDEELIDHWECSVCGRYIPWEYHKDWNYCPNCGAKMDGDGNV